MSASFAAVYVPEFPIAAWHRSSPELRSRPCAVFEGVPPQEEVVSLCRRAQAAGIEHGMSKVQAETGGSTLFRTRSVEEEVGAFAALLEVAERFSPRVEVAASPQNGYANADRLAVVLLLDSAGTGKLFGAAQSYAHKLSEAVQDAGFPASVGMAPNAAAALVLARSGKTVVCATQGDVRSKLAPLPVHLLPCETKVLAVLSRWGIRTLGELSALPETALVSRLGQAGRSLQLFARGEADHLLVPEQPAFTLTETVALDNPVELLESLLFVLSPMLEAMMSKALRNAYALRSVKLTLQLERGASHAVAVHPATPTQNRDALVKLLNLELQAHPPGAGIVGATLEAEFAKPQTAQRGLFQAQFPEPDILELLLARLRSIAGEGNVGSPELRNSWNEESFNMAPFRPCQRVDTAKRAPSSQLALRVFRPPQPVRVVCWGTQPQSLFWQGSRFAVRSSMGPWHASGSWWSGDAWDHDLWDVVTAEPVQMLQLRQEYTTKAWFVVGLYD